ncbi:hypothetical protein Ancab_026468 [Ancistrocladus abbreviatus]
MAVKGCLSDHDRLSVCVKTLALKTGGRGTVIVKKKKIPDHTELEKRERERETAGLSTTTTSRPKTVSLPITNSANFLLPQSQVLTLSGVFDWILGFWIPSRRWWLMIMFDPSDSLIFWGMWNGNALITAEIEQMQQRWNLQSLMFDGRGKDVVKDDFEESDNYSLLVYAFYSLALCDWDRGSTMPEGAIMQKIFEQKVE